MSILNSCCCDKLTSGIVVAGSGSDQEVGQNPSNIHLYAAEVEDTCLPCSGKTIHGTITVNMQWDTGRVQTFLVGYSELANNNSVIYFPQVSLNIISENQVEITNSPVFSYTRDESINEFIAKIKEHPMEVEGEKLKICDCFTDVMYTSSEKTEKQNNIAIAQKALCEHFKVGVNALHLKWKPSKYLGEHDTSIMGVNGVTIYPCSGINTDKPLVNFTEDCQNNIPQLTQYQRTIFLPENLKNKVVSPVAYNLYKLYYGPNYNEDTFPWEDSITSNTIEDVSTPGTPDTSPYYDFTHNWRIFIGSLALTNSNIKNTNKYRFFNALPDSFTFLWKGYVNDPSLLNVMFKCSLGERRTPTCCEKIQGGVEITESTNSWCGTVQTCEGTAAEFPRLRCETTATKLTPEVLIKYKQPIKYFKLQNSSSNKSLVYFTYGCLIAPTYEEGLYPLPGTLLSQNCGPVSTACCECSVVEYITPGKDGANVRSRGHIMNGKYSISNFSFNTTTQNESTNESNVLLGNIFGNNFRSFKFWNISRTPNRTTRPKDECETQNLSNYFCANSYLLIPPKNIIPYAIWTVNGNLQTLIELIETTEPPVYNNFYDPRYAMVLNEGRIPASWLVKRSTYTGRNVSCQPKCCTEDEKLCNWQQTISGNEYCCGGGDTFYLVNNFIQDCNAIFEDTTETNTDYCYGGSSCTTTTTTSYVNLGQISDDDECNFCDDFVVESGCNVGDEIPKCVAESIPKLLDKFYDETTWGKSEYLLYNDEPHENYIDFLINKINNLTSVKKPVDATIVPDSCHFEDDWQTQSSIDKNAILQSKCTSLYGKTLEFGSIDLKPVDSTLNLSDYFKNYDGSSFEESWPQSISYNSSLSDSQTILFNNRDDIITILRNRKSQYPAKSNKIVYWKERIIYEIADAFAVVSKPTLGDALVERCIPDIKSEWYKAGIPDLNYSNKKIKISENGTISIETQETEYTLNWFNISFDAIVV